MDSSKISNGLIEPKTNTNIYTFGNMRFLNKGHRNFNRRSCGIYITLSLLFALYILILYIM